jgi:hypothetical protein
VRRRAAVLVMGLAAGSDASGQQIAASPTLAAGHANVGTLAGVVAVRIG